MTDKEIKELVREVAALIRALKKHPSYREYINVRADVAGRGDGQGMALTIGVDLDGSWGWQSGDNSFTGGAYGFPAWGVGIIDGRCNSNEVAKAMVGEAVEQLSER